MDDGSLPAWFPDGSEFLITSAHAINRSHGYFEDRVFSFCGIETRVFGDAYKNEYLLTYMCDRG